MALQSQTLGVRQFDPTWLGFGGVHGGLLLGSLAEAAAAELGAFPATVTAHMYAPVPPGEYDITVDVVRGGRSGSAVAQIAGHTTALVRTSREPIGTPTWATTRPPADVDPAGLPTLELPVDFVPFSRHLDIRPVNAARPFGGGDTPEFVVWIRLRDDAGLGTEARAAVLLDALPPGLFAILTRPVLIPTIEMTAHFAPHADAGPWHYLRHRTVWSTADLAVDETELFTATGELAAQGRQLRRIVEMG